MNCNVCNSKETSIKNKNDENFLRCNNCFHIQQHVEKRIENNKKNDFLSLSLFLLLRYYYINKNIKSKIKILIITDFIDKSQFKLLDNLKIMLKNIGNDNNIYPTIVNFRSIEKDENEIFDFFDIILIQNFNKCENPQKIMKIISNNSYIFINTKKFINSNEYDNNFFNSNSMKILCDKNNVCLNMVLHNDDEYLFEITKEKTFDSNLIDELYNEIVQGVYD